MNRQEIIGILDDLETVDLAKVLPKGNQKDCTTCPLAKYLQGVTKLFRVHVGDDTIEFAGVCGLTMSTKLAGFVGDFDAGQYPELILNNPEVA